MDCATHCAMARDGAAADTWPQPGLHVGCLWLQVRWLEMRGEALLGVALPEQAYASFQRCFEAGMAECGIELAAAERDAAHGREAGRPRKEKAHEKGHEKGPGLLGRGALLGQGLAKIMRDHARLVKRRSKGADGGLAEEQVPGARSGLRAHAALLRALSRHDL